MSRLVIVHEAKGRRQVYDRTPVGDRIEYTLVEMDADVVVPAKSPRMGLVKLASLVLAFTLGIMKDVVIDNIKYGVQLIATTIADLLIG